MDIESVLFPFSSFFSTHDRLRKFLKRSSGWVTEDEYKRLGLEIQYTDDDIHSFGPIVFKIDICNDTGDFTPETIILFFFSSYNQTFDRHIWCWCRVLDFYFSLNCLGRSHPSKIKRSMSFYLRTLEGQGFSTNFSYGVFHWNEFLWPLLLYKICDLKWVSCQW